VDVDRDIRSGRQIRIRGESSARPGRDVAMIATFAANKAFHVGLVLTVFGFGFRHGIDWDHIAALTDITSSQNNSRRSMFLATLYAIGHGLVVFALGFAAIVFAQQLPRGVDVVMERFVGATLI